MSVIKWCCQSSLLLCLVGTQLQADWQPDYVGAGATYTADAKNGLGVKLGWQLNADWDFTARLEHGVYERKHTVNLVEFDESFARTSVGVFAERLVPGTSGLRFVGGLLHFDKASEWAANPNVSAIYQLNGRYYSGLNLGNPKATIGYRPLIPFVGLSWTSGSPQQKGWALNVDAGVMFSLDPELAISSDNPSDLEFLNDDLQYEADTYVERLKTEGDFLESAAPRIGISAIYRF
ncbi:MAG: hypothetical protein ACPGVP_21225 [Thiolinea sp.]